MDVDGWIAEVKQCAFLDESAMKLICDAVPS
jgi:hypothetical protein